MGPYCKVLPTKKKLQLTQNYQRPVLQNYLKKFIIVHYIKKNTRNVNAYTAQEITMNKRVRDDVFTAHLRHAD